MTNSKEKLKLDDLRLIEHHNKGGIGSRQIRFGKLAFIDPCPLTENLEEVLTSVHLNKVEFVEVVNDTQDGDEKKQYIICFLDEIYLSSQLMKLIFFLNTYFLTYALFVACTTYGM